jgi:hypothetical protein
MYESTIVTCSGLLLRKSKPYGQNFCYAKAAYSGRINLSDLILADLSFRFMMVLFFMQKIP